MLGEYLCDVRCAQFNVVVIRNDNSKLKQESLTLKHILIKFRAHGGGGRRWIRLPSTYKYDFVVDKVSFFSPINIHCFEFCMHSVSLSLCVCVSECARKKFV